MSLLISKYERMLQSLSKDNEYPNVKILSTTYVLKKEISTSNKDEDLLLWEIELDTTYKQLAEKRGDVAQWIKENSDNPVIFAARTEDNNHLIFFEMGKDAKSIQQLSKQKLFSERFEITVKDIELINGAILYASMTSEDSKEDKDMKPKR